jgi:stage III sporulation protein SpoIIIAA
MLLFQLFLALIFPQFTYQILQEQIPLPILPEGIKPPITDCIDLRNQIEELRIQSLERSKLNFLQRHDTEKKFNIVDEQINNLNQQLSNLNSQTLNNSESKTEQEILQQQITKLQAEREKLIEQIALISKEEYENLSFLSAFNSRLAFECPFTPPFTLD